jgi:hypothetical protein
MDRKNLKIKRMMLAEDMRSIIAVIMFLFGKKPSYSTFIDEETITAGYGRLDAIGIFKYELPKKYIKKIFKTTKWAEVVY